MCVFLWQNICEFEEKFISLHDFSRIVMYESDIC